MSKLLTYTGSILTLHSAYSCLHYRSLINSHSTHPPVDVVIEVAIGFVLCLLGRLSSVSFCKITERAGGSGAVHCTRDFDIYNTRARIFLGNK